MRLVLLLTVSGLAVYASLTRTGLIDRIPMVADSIADWLVSQAALDGLDPYTPIEDLAATYDVDYTSPLAGANPTHPRLPGALFLQIPMTLTDAVSASYWLVGISLACVVLIGWRLLERTGSSLPATLGFLLFASSSGLAVWAFGWVSQSIVIMALFYFAVAKVQSRDSQRLVGVLIGMMAVLKPLWLVLIIPFALWKRWVTVGVALGIFTVLNAIGLLWFDLLVVDVIGELGESFEVWFDASSNISFGAWVGKIVPMGRASVLAIHAVLLIAWCIRAMRSPRHHLAEFMGWTVMGVLVSPLAWPHYLIVCLPTIWIFVDSKEIPKVPRLIALVGVLALWPIKITPLLAIGVVLLLVAVLLSPPMRFAELQPSRKASDRVADTQSTNPA